MNTVDPAQDRGYSIVSLSTLLEYLGEEKTSNILSSFKTRMESDTETFLREKAIEMGGVISPEHTSDYRPMAYPFSDTSLLA